MSNRAGFWAFVVVAATLAGCHRHVATPTDCRAILNRLVEMELTESGFRDPALVPRWQDELAHRFEDELRLCRAVRVRDDLTACLRTAQNPEQIAHSCVQ